MSVPEETELDDFGWLPDAVAARGRGPVPPPERVELPGGLSALRWGSGDPTVVLLHGAGQNAHTWDLVAALADVPALAVDLPGHGHSPWRTDRDYGPDRNAAAVAAALDGLHLRPEAVVGMSLGGLTTIALLGARPDLVPRAMIVDVLPLTADSPPLRRDALGQVALIAGPREFPTLEAMVDATVAVAPGRPVADLRRGVLHNARRTADGRYRWRYDDLDLVDRISHDALWDALGGSSAPFLLVRGGASAFVPVESIEELGRVRPDARVVVVDGAPHAVQSAAPDVVTRLLLELLSDR